MALLREVMPDYQSYLDLGMSKDEVRSIAKNRAKLQKQRQQPTQPQVVSTPIEQPQQSTVKDGALFRSAQGVSKGTFKNARAVTNLYDSLTTQKTTPYLIDLQKNNVPLDNKATLPSDFSAPIVVKDGKLSQASASPKLRSDTIASSGTKFLNKHLNTIDKNQKDWQKRHPNQTDIAGTVGEFAADMATDPTNYIPFAAEARLTRLAAFSGLGAVSGGMHAIGDGADAKGIAKSTAMGAVLAPVFGESLYMLSKGGQKLYKTLAQKLQKNPKVADTLEGRSVNAEIKAHEEDAQIKEKVDVLINEGATPEQIKEVRKQNTNITEDDAHISEVLNDGALLQPEMAGFNSKVMLENSIKSKRYNPDEFLSILKNEYNLQDDYALKMTEAYSKEDPNILMDWANKKLKDHNNQTKTYDNLEDILKEEKAQTQKLQEGISPKEVNPSEDAQILPKNEASSSTPETLSSQGDNSIAQNLDILKEHPRFAEVIDNARNRKATDIRYAQKLVQKRSGNKDYNAGALYEKNYNADFQLTKQDIKAIESGKVTPEIEAKIQNDLGVMDNNPEWQIPDENTLHVKDIPIDAQGNVLGDDGKPLFANGGGTLAGGFFGGADSAINERDYNNDGKHDYKDILYGVATGAISINALKKAAPKLFEMPKGGNKIGTFVGAKPGEAGAFSDTETKALMKEIDDSGAALDIAKLEKDAATDPYLMTEQKLGDVLTHNKLLDKYPELKNINIVYDSPKGVKKEDLYYGASYNPKDKTMILGNGLNDKEIKSALLHEIQHAIQNKEGWAKGGNVEEMDRFIDSLNPNKIKEMFLMKAESYKKLSKGKLSDELKQSLEAEYKDAIDKYNKAVKEHNGKSSYELYQSLWGERQARATAYREKMTPEQRAKESWQQTLARIEGDSANTPSIIKYDDGISMSIPKDKKTFRDDLKSIKKEMLPKLSDIEFTDITQKQSDTLFEFLGSEKTHGVFNVGNRKIQIDLTVKTKVTTGKHEIKANKTGGVTKEEVASMPKVVDNVASNISNHGGRKAESWKVLTNDGYELVYAVKSINDNLDVLTTVHTKSGVGERINSASFNDPMASTPKDILPNKAENIKLLEEDMLAKQSKVLEGDTSNANLKRKQEYLKAKDTHARAVIKAEREADPNYKPSVENLDAEIKTANDEYSLMKNTNKIISNKKTNEAQKLQSLEELGYNKIKAKEVLKAGGYDTPTINSANGRVNALKSETYDTAMQNGGTTPKNAKEMVEGSIKLHGGIAKPVLDMITHPFVKLQKMSLDAFDNMGKIKTVTKRAKVEQITAQKFKELTGVDAKVLEDGATVGDFVIEKKNDKTFIYRTADRKEWKNENMSSALKNNFFDNASDDYVKMIHLKDASEANSLKRATSYHEKLKTIDKKLGKQLVHALDGDVDPKTLPLKLQKTYNDFRSLVDERAKLLVDLGMLDEKDLNENYLRRYYEEYTRAAGILEGMKNSMIGRDKSGGINGTLGANHKRKLMSLEERMKRGQIFDASFVIPATLQAQERQILKGKFFDDIAKNFGALEELKGYVQVPNDKRFGNLAGKYLPSNMHYSIVKAPEFTTGVLRYYDQIFSHWKVNKTVKNPFTHAYNVGSNIELMVLSHTDPTPFTNNLLGGKWNEMTQRAEQYGLVDDTRLIHDLGEVLAANKSFIEKASDKNKIFAAFEAIYKNAYMTEDSKLGKFMRSTYNWEDKIFKIIAMEDNIFKAKLKKYEAIHGETTLLQRPRKEIDAIKLSEDEEYKAFAEANKQFIDYARPLPPAIDWVNRRALPFTNFSYKSTPIMIRSMIQHPTTALAINLAGGGVMGRLALGATAIAGYEKAHQFVNDYLYQDINKEPHYEWMSGSKMFGIKVPYDNLMAVDSWRKTGGDKNQTYYFNQGRAVQGMRADFIQSAVTLGMLGQIAGYGSGRDLKTGREYYKKDDTATTKAKKTIYKMAKDFLPSTWGSYAGKFYESLRYGENLYGEPMKPSDVALNALGFRRVDNAKAERRALNQVQPLINKVTNADKRKAWAKGQRNKYIRTKGADGFSERKYQDQIQKIEDEKTRYKKELVDLRTQEKTIKGWSGYSKADSKKSRRSITGIPKQLIKLDF